MLMLFFDSSHGHISFPCNVYCTTRFFSSSWNAEQICWVYIWSCPHCPFGEDMYRLKPITYISASFPVISNWQKTLSIPCLKFQQILFCIISVRLRLVIFACVVHNCMQIFCTKAAIFLGKSTMCHDVWNRILVPYRVDNYSIRR